MTDILKIRYANLRMIVKIIITLAIVIMAMTCAVFPRIEDAPPYWLSGPAFESNPNTKTSWKFLGIGVAENRIKAMDAAIDQLLEAIIDKIDLGLPEQWEPESRKIFNEFQNRFSLALRSSGKSAIEGITIQNAAFWKEGAGVAHGIEILWDKNNFANQMEIFTSIAGSVGTTSDGKLELFARQSEDEGSLYEAALLWAAIAGNAEISGNESATNQAIKEVLRILKGVEYKIISAPTDAFVGIDPQKTIIIQSIALGNPVGNAQFVVTSQSGKKIQMSDSNGNINFQLPTALQAGTQTIFVNIDPDSFLQYLNNKDVDYVQEFVTFLTENGFLLEYEAVVQDKLVPTGVFIYETDLAGNSLKTDSTASGIVDNLQTAGYDIEKISLADNDPDKEIIATWEKIRENKTINRRFERVILGTVSLANFEQDGDSFAVSVEGTLYLTDMATGKILHSSSISKTGRTGDSKQAVNAAFRQLGRSFAAEILARNNANQ